MKAKDKKIGETVDVRDKDCPFRSCYWPRPDPGEGRNMSEIAELRRRLQAAKKAARQNVEECKHQGISLGRSLANWAASDYEGKRDTYRDLCRRMDDCLREISYSGVEMDDERIDYLIVQVDRNDWNEAKELHAEFERMERGSQT